MPSRNNKRELENDEAPNRSQSKRLHVSTARDTTKRPVQFERKNSKQKMLLSSQDSGSFVAKNTRSGASKDRVTLAHKEQDQSETPQKVICRMNFVQIESVSLEEKTFKVELYLYCTTRRGESNGEPEPMSTAFADDHKDRLTFSSSVSDEMSPHGGGGMWPSRVQAKRPGWRPEFLLTQETKDLKWETDDDKCVAFTDGTHAWRRHLTMKVASPMQLQSFPFDGQVLNINLTFDACDTIVQVDEELCEAKLMQDATMLLTDEYHVGRPFFEPELYDPIASASMSGKSYWHVKWSIPVIRKTTYYELNAFMPLFIVVASSWTVFSLPNQEKFYPERLSLLVSLLLTLIALKFSLTSMLPKLSYHTMLDLYFMGGYFALALTIAECAFVYTMSSKHAPAEVILPLGQGIEPEAISPGLVVGEERFGRLMIALYTFNFLKPFILGKYWVWKAQQKKTEQEAEEASGDLFLFDPLSNIHVSMTWTQWIMKCLESACVACFFWSGLIPQVSWEMIPICLLVAGHLIASSLSTIDHSFRDRDRG